LLSGFRALVPAIIDHYETRIPELEADLSRLKKSLQNCSLPHSSQHPLAKPPVEKPKSKKKRGGQPGHAKHEQPLLPSGDCDNIQILKPAQYQRQYITATTSTTAVRT
jgi:transposase